MVKRRGTEDKGVGRKSVGAVMLLGCIRGVACRVSPQCACRGAEIAPGVVEC